MSSYYVTTPIYYVNAAPHLGHAYTTIAADVMARHHRQRGEEVFFLTGTDEHGEPVADAAHALGIEPQELADRNAERFKALAPRIEASNDFFIRTTDPQHIAKVQEVLARVRENGYVYEGTVRGLVLPALRGLQGRERDRRGQPLPDPSHRADARAGGQLLLQAVRVPGAARSGCIAERQEFVAPRTRYNEALSFIRSGLRDVPLTRHRLTWGVPVPWDSEHVFYVWFDALLNYYSALSYAPAPAGSRRRRPHGHVLAGRLPCDREGHPALSRRLLARAADGRRAGAARAGVRARVPADGRREDVASRWATCSTRSR